MTQRSRVTHPYEQFIKARLRSSGWIISKSRFCSDAGYSLFEVSVALFLSAIVSYAAIQIWLSVWGGFKMDLMNWQTEGSWASLSRVSREDIHAATLATILLGTLQLQLADGTQYRYLVNSAGQFVRIRTGGGTSVLADGVARVTPSVNAGVVTLTVTFVNGFDRTLEVCTLRGMP